MYSHPQDLSLGLVWWEALLELWNPISASGAGISLHLHISDKKAECVDFLPWIWLQTGILSSHCCLLLHALHDPERGCILASCAPTPHVCQSLSQGKMLVLWLQRGQICPTYLKAISESQSPPSSASTTLCTGISCHWPWWPPRASHLG